MSVPPTCAPRRLDWAKRIRDGAARLRSSAVLRAVVVVRSDHAAAVFTDLLGDAQQSADEVEVLFTLIAERYERRSMILTSNLAFGEWDRIFKNPMTTAA